MLRCQLAPQHRSARRDPQKGLVGVPLLRRVLGFRPCAIGLDVGDGKDVRVAGWGVTAGEPCYRQRAKSTREREVLVMVQPLFAKKEDAALAQQLPHLANAFVRNIIAAFQVDTHNFAAYAPRNGAALKLRHASSGTGSCGLLDGIHGVSPYWGGLDGCLPAN